MNPVVKAQWVAALRSGEYQQGQGCLRNGRGFCCLGVLVDLYIRETKGAGWTVFDGIGTFDRESFHLPGKVMRWAGLNDISPGPRDKKLSALNDNGISFAEIAELIEARL